MYATLLITTAALFAQPADPLQAQADRVVDLINGEIEDPSDLMATSFLKQVPAARLTAISDQFLAAYGKANSIVLTDRQSNLLAGGTVLFERGTQMPTRIGIESVPPHKIHTLWFGAATAPTENFDEVIKQLRELPGKANFQVVKLGDKPKPLASHNPNLALAIGSAFKLYVLGALADGHHAWDKVIPLKEAYHSLPGGVTQSWPADSPVTLHTLAVQMISISDNTATDALIRYLGRETVEAQLAAMGHSKPKTTQPFLTTGEMFRIKSDADLLARYIAADEDSRRELLDGRIAGMSLTGSPYTTGKPIAIDTVEWFASAGDLCMAMNYVNAAADQHVLDILAVNPGATSMQDRFAYMGFKGGSEPGVVNLTWLLKTKKGTSFALSTGWNNRDEEVDVAKLLGIAQSAMLLIEDK